MGNTQTRDLVGEIAEMIADFYSRAVNTADRQLAERIINRLREGATKS